MRKAGEIGSTKNSYPDIFDSIILLTILLFILIGTAFIISLFTTEIDQNWVFSVLYLLSMSVVIIVGFNRKRIFKPDFQFNFRLNSLKTTLQVSVSTLLLILVVDYLLLFIPFESDIETSFGFLNNWSVISFLSLIIAPAVLEELLFRGIILDGLANKYSKINAVILSALFFGIIHFDYIQSIYTFFLGLFLGWVYVTSKGGIFLVILIHAINNFISWLFFNIYGSYNVYEIINISSDWLVALIAVLLFTVTTLFLNKNLRSLESS